MIRIALIGGGPKSLFALLALHDCLPVTAAPHIAVDVYDPLPPGSGSVWRNDQPDVLRLNVHAGIVDTSSSMSRESFVMWMNRVAPDKSGDKYPPRTLVGRYLREQFQLLSQHGNVTVAHAPFVVTGVEREGLQWRVNGHFGTHTYDEVLLATGHGLADAEPWEPLPGALNKHPLIGDYSSLTMAEIPPDSAVWIRGAALTAYDVALLLTEGRGGSWQRTEDDGGADAGLRYTASGREPRRITLSCRSGFLMDPKSETVPDEVAACLERSKRTLRQWAKVSRDAMPDDGVSLAGMWVVLLDCAQECARIMGLTVSPLALWRTALTGQSVDAESGITNGPNSVGAAARLRASLAVNHGKAPLTTGWLWARVWSGLYPELVAALDRMPRSTRAWRQFARLAHNFERFTFGPPELTARKLVALFDAGILHLAAPEDRAGKAVVIDAVTPGPGVLRAPAPGGRPHTDLIAGLLRTGDISLRAGDRGLLTEPDGTCLAKDGSRSESLAALGRPTEDPTLGHDTLNRALHGEYRLWARRVAALVPDRSEP